MGSQSFWFFPTRMRIIIAITFSLALVECRRHLCDDMTRPVCPGGAKAVYNRPTGKNTKGSTYFPPPTCPGQGPFGAKPFCEDGSTPAFRFNGCKYEELKCPNGQGKPPHCPGGGPRCDRPFTVCQDGSPCACPGGGKGCAFVHRRCANGDKCHRQCKTGQPHCPWFTKNRNPHNGTRIHNAGPRRPGNKEGGHNWQGDFPGNRPYPDLVNQYGPFGKLSGERKHFTDRFASQNGDLPITQVKIFEGNYLGHKDVIVGIQFEYDGVPGEVRGKSTGRMVSASVPPGETIEKITIRSFEEGLPKPNNLIFFLKFELSDGTTIETTPTSRGKMHVIPQVRDNVIPTQDNDIPGGTGLAFITGYEVIDTPRGMLGQLRFFFHYP